MTNDEPKQYADRDIRDLVIDRLHACIAELEAELITARADAWDEGRTSDIRETNPYRKDGE